MTVICVSLNKEAALFTDPDSDEGKLQNLLLNMMGGLEYCNLTNDEKQLMMRHGYEPEKGNET